MLRHGGQVMDEPENPRRELDDTMRQIAESTGATLHIYPRPGEAVRRVVLRDMSDEQGTRYEDVVIETDGTIRVTGHDTGPGVSNVFGPEITSYEWVYVVPPERAASLVEALGGREGDDPVDLLTAYYQRTRGVLYHLLTSPPVNASFDNWHS
jgi:hypothetical protein